MLRRNISTALVSVVLPALGAALGIYQLRRLHEYGVGGGLDPTAVALAEKNATLFPPFVFYTAPTNVTRSAEESLYRSNCINLNPGYQIRTYDDEACRELVSDAFPEWLALYDDLDVPVMRADMWRYLILYKFGGVYLDGDVDCKRPIDEWADVFGIAKDDPDRSTRLGAMVGIEYRRPAEGVPDTYPPRLQFVQWTMAAQPRHPIYYRAVELINETISAIRSGAPAPGSAVYVTGPVVFSRAIVEFMIHRGRIRSDQIVAGPPNNHDILLNDSSIVETADFMVGNLAILHEDAFAYRGNNRGKGVARRDGNHHTVYARHWYRGRWKPGGWREKSDRHGLFRDVRINSVVGGGGPQLAQVVVSK